MKAGQHKLPPRIAAFLAAIRVMPCVARAAEAAGINKSAHYMKLRRDKAYAQLFADSLQIGVDSLADVAIERAQMGWEEPLVYQGHFCYPAKLDKKTGKHVPDKKKGPLTVRKIDNRLLEFVLSRRHPDFKEKIEHSGELDLNVLMEKLNAGRQRVADAKRQAGDSAE